MKVYFFISSGLLAILLVIVSITGIMTPHFYKGESLNWQMQSIGQDMFDLHIIVPLLVCLVLMSFYKPGTTRLLWAGLLLYIMYSFAIYCFDVHFNKLFPIYCLILGLSFYSFCFVIYEIFRNRQPVVDYKKSLLSMITGVYFILISVVFFCLWMIEIIPAVVHNHIPQSLQSAGLATNPVHVLDLSVFLPGIFLTGLILIRGKQYGYYFSIILLFFFILMDLTIAWLTIYVREDGVQNLSVAYIMILLTVISTGLLVWNLDKQPVGS